MYEWNHCRVRPALPVLTGNVGGHRTGSNDALDRNIYSRGKQIKQEIIHIFFTHHPPTAFIALLGHALGAQGGGVPSSV